LNGVRANGDWEAWLGIFSLGRARHRGSGGVFQEHRQKIEALGRAAATVLRVFELYLS